MISGLADAALLLAKPDWADMARTAFAAIRSHHWQDGRLHHSWRNGRLRYDATAEGYAHLITAALALAAITPGGDHLSFARTLTQAMIARLWDEDKGAFAFATKEARLIIRNVQGHDDATPNANAVMLRNLARLHHLTGAADYLASRPDFNGKDLAVTGGSQGGGLAIITAGAEPRVTLLAASVPALCDHAGIAHGRIMSGKGGDLFADDRFRRLIAATGPNAIIQWIEDPSALPADHPARQKSAGAASRAYLCRGQVCAAPAETVAEVDEALALLGLTDSRS